MPKGPLTKIRKGVLIRNPKVLLLGYGAQAVPGDLLVSDVNALKRVNTGKLERL